MPNVSVIVPVYKVEKLLPRCIDSILGQTFRDFELILVDDGSPDNSGAVCDSYAAADERIRVIHQENRGASAARNRGLSESTGKYVAFVDSDDYVAGEFLERLFRAAENSDASQVVCETFQVKNGVLAEKTHHYGSAVIEKADILEEIIDPLAFHEDQPKHAGLPNVHNKLYLRQVIADNALRFDETFHHGEDWLFNICFYRFAERVVFIEDKLYYYDIGTEGSLSKRYREDFMEHAYIIVKLFHEWFPEIYDDDRCSEYLTDKHFDCLKYTMKTLGWKGIFPLLASAGRHEELKAAFDRRLGRGRAYTRAYLWLSPVILAFRVMKNRKS